MEKNSARNDRDWKPDVPKNVVRDSVTGDEYDAPKEGRQYRVIR